MEVEQREDKAEKKRQRTLRRRGKKDEEVKQLDDAEVAVKGLNRHLKKQELPRKTCLFPNICTME